jgi:hypothetical protein
VSRTAAARVNLTHRELHGPSPKERKELRRNKKPKKPSLFGTRGSSFAPRISGAGAGSVRFGTYKRDEPTLFDTGLAKYSPDQARDEQGQFKDEGKGGSHGGWSRTAAVAAGGVLTAAALAHPAGRGLRALAGKLRADRLKAMRMARHMERGRRLTQPTALERLARQHEAAGLRPRPARRGVLDRLNTAADRKLGPATSRLDRALDKLPPKARREAGDLLRGGGENPLEFNPFKILEFFH